MQQWFLAPNEPLFFKFWIQNCKLYVQTHSQHIRNHISNNFPHLHNVNRGLETITKSKIWKNQLMPVVNSATVFFGRQTSRYRWKFECLQACRLSEPILCSSNMMLLTPCRIQNTSNEAWKQAKSEKRPNLLIFLVVLSQSQLQRVRGGGYEDGYEVKKFFLPKMFPSARKPRKSDYFTHLLCYFSRYFTFSFLFLWLFFSTGPERPIFNGNPKNRKFGGNISRKQRNMLKNPFVLPKMTLWWGLDSSLRSRIAHTEPISVTAPAVPGVPTVPNGSFSMGLAKSQIWSYSWNKTTKPA